MQIAKRYLTEIEEICHGKCSEEVAQTLYWAVLNHWNLPDEYSGLFEYCRPIGCRIACSCLTQVRSSWNGDLKINGVIDFQGRSIVDLSERLATDDRIVDNEDNIFPEDLRWLTFPLTEDQKKRVREVLLPYAEWQTRLRLYYQDTPIEELELQEVV